MTFYFQTRIVWQKSFELTKKIYSCLKKFPREEQYALTDQMRRSSVSIMSNIAEGSGRGTNQERNHFYHIAKGSAMELASQILLAKDFGYIEESIADECLELIEEITKIIYTVVKIKNP